MKKHSILIVDKEPKNLKILEDNFIEANYQVDAATSAYEALEKIRTKSYNVILSEVSGPSIDGYHLLEQIQRESLNANVPVIFLTQKSDIWNRVKSFKLGAKDYIVKPMHVKEIIARVNMVVARMERQNAEETIAKKKFSGRLEDLNLTDLIEVFGIERKTGVLSIYNENSNTGQVYFKNGSLINAASNGSCGEEAIFKMMSWHGGRFSMLFTDVDVEDDISISNMGILLEGAKRMEQREELLKQLPSLNAVVVTTSNFKKILDKKSLSPDLKKFLTLFDGERTLGRIIDECQEDEITALSRILKLYRLGFLHILRDFSREPVPQNDGEEVLEPVSAKTLEKEVNATPSPLPPVWQDQKTEYVDEEENQFPSTQTHKIESETAASDDQNGFYYKAPDESEAVEEEIWKTGKTEPEPEEQVVQAKAPSSKDSFFDFQNLLTEQQEPKSQRSPFAASSVKTPTAESRSPQVAYPAKHPADALFEVGLDQTSPLEAEEEQPRSPEQSETKEINPEPDEKAEKQSVQDDRVAKELFQKAKGSILVLGTDDSSRMELVDSLSANDTLKTSVDLPDISDIYYGTAEFKGNQYLNIISFSVKKEFTPLVEYFSKKVLGYILVFDPKETNWSYYNYLLNVLRSKLHKPSTIVFYHPEDMEDLQEEDLRSQLSLQKDEGLKICNQLDEVTSKRIIFSLFEQHIKPKMSSPSR
ncbi:MAG: response regulator [Calditrichaeota bacterium]|nr:response regulator [Calditrichota bacterium]